MQGGFELSRWKISVIFIPHDCRKPYTADEEVGFWHTLHKSIESLKGERFTSGFSHIKFTLRVATKTNFYDSRTRQPYLDLEAMF